VTADNGVSGAGDVKYGITLNGNNFGGAVSANGSNVSLTDNNGGSTLTLGNTTATGTLYVNSLGPITQAAGTTINATGTTTLSAYWVYPVYNCGNFGCQFEYYSYNYYPITLVDSSTSGLTLGYTTAGALTLTSQGGPITQAAGTSYIYVTGTSSLTAGKGSTNYNITLGNPYNYFGGTVSANGLNINLLDGASTGLTLGNTTATGTLVVNSAGPITQAANTAIKATGTSSFLAAAQFYYSYNYYCGCYSWGYSGSSPITLANTVTVPNTGNNFGGAVSSTGSNVSLFDSGTSGLTLGNTTATGTLTLDSLGGAITQIAGTTAVNVTGATSLTAENGSTYYAITLQNANNFTGAVTATGGGSGGIMLTDTSALTTTLNSKTNAYLSSGGPMYVQGTIAGILTTVTTGPTAATGATTFGNTAVGKRLTVTTPTGAAVKEAASCVSPCDLMVGGQATDPQHNGSVTVNGVTGVLIQ
jgi:hypothetical protein